MGPLSHDGQNSALTAVQFTPKLREQTSYLDVLHHPRFDLARTHYLRTVVHARNDDPVMNHFVNDIARTVLSNIILGQHFAAEINANWPALTIGQLRDLFLPFRLASARSLDQMLARMTHIGLITIQPTLEDRRRKIITPTEKLIREDLFWLADHMSPLAVLYPNVTDYEPARLHDRRYQRAQRLISTQNYSYSRSALDVDNPVLSLLQRQHGAKILYIYLLNAIDAGTPTLATLSFELAGQRSRTSRTHVRNLFNALADLGMVKLLGRGGANVEFSPQLLEISDTFLAKSMWGHDLVWQHAHQLVQFWEGQAYATNSAPNQQRTA